MKILGIIFGCILGLLILFIIGIRIEEYILEKINQKKLKENLEHEKWKKKVKKWALESKNKDNGKV
tara:strand:+ start:179 stop:376 length:198 start_codon:yes stop_codon:yes gene_type:complete